MANRELLTDVNINVVSAVIEEVHHSSIRKLTDDLHVQRMSIQHIFTKVFEMKHVHSMWVPHFLQTEEMERHRSMCSKNLA